MPDTHHPSLGDTAILVGEVITVAYASDTPPELRSLAVKMEDGQVIWTNARNVRIVPKRPEAPPVPAYFRPSESGEEDRVTVAALLEEIASDASR